MTIQAYIICNNEVVATVITELKNGAEVEFSSLVLKNKINQAYEFNLVNSHRGKISRAKKWSKKAIHASAVEINDGEFQISWPCR